MTPVESVRTDPLCDRRVALYGYLRGCNLMPGARVHLAGVGDFSLSDVSVISDPCPLPGSTKRRSLDERERLLYAPMSDVGRLLYDKDAMYVNIADHTVNFTRAEPGEEGAREEAVETAGVQMVRGLQGAALALNEKLQRSNIRIFGGGESDEEGSGEEEEEEAEEAEPVPAKRQRRAATFLGADDPVASGGSGSDEESDSEASTSSSSDDEEEGEEEEEGLGGAAQWKQRLGTQERPALDLMVRLPPRPRGGVVLTPSPCRRLCTAPRGRACSPPRPRSRTRRRRRRTGTSCSDARRAPPARWRRLMRWTAPSAAWGGRRPWPPGSRRGRWRRSATGS